MSDAPPADPPPAQPQPLASQAAAAQPVQGGHRPRAHPHHRGQGQGGAPGGRAPDHPGQAGRSARPAAGAVQPGPGQVRGAQAVRGGRPPLRRPPRRLHADPQAGPSPVGRDRDGLSRAGLTSKLVLEYDGSRFAGWAAQPGLRTVQEEVEGALTTVLRQPVSLTAAGRTDRGVHAWGQVVSYQGPPAPLTGVNALLGDEVAVRESAQAPDGFDARRDALSRTYCYRVLARPAPSPFEQGRALWWPHRVERDAL